MIGASLVLFHNHFGTGGPAFHTGSRGSVDLHPLKCTREKGNASHRYHLKSFKVNGRGKSLKDIDYVPLIASREYSQIASCPSGPTKTAPPFFLLKSRTFDERSFRTVYSANTN